MKYFAFIVGILLLAASDSCGSQGLYWQFDGHRHVIVWGNNR